MASTKNNNKKGKYKDTGHRPNIASKAYNNHSVLSGKKNNSKVTWKVDACWALLHSGAQGSLPSRSFGGGDMWPVVDGGAGVLLLRIHAAMQPCWRRAGSRASLLLGCPEQPPPNKAERSLPP